MTGTTSLSVRDNTSENRFEAVDGSHQVAGYAAYDRGDGRVVFTHTVVDDAFEGRGVGSELIRGALDAARRDGLRVVPQCQFVAAFIDKHEEYADLVE
jgi:predicted GNAT family acetyltransferase